MNVTFGERLRADIQRSERVRAEMVQRAEQARQIGDQEEYWMWTRPMQLGALYYIAGEWQRARTYYRQSADYYQCYRDWATRHGKEVPLSLTEANVYMMAGKRNLARTTLLELAARVSPEKAELLGIPLICAGAVKEGRVLLQRRLSRFRQECAQDAMLFYQQGEMALWMGNVTLARSFGNCSIATWHDLEPRPPVIALHLLYHALANPQKESAVAAAHAALEECIRWFYADGLLSHAVDACEYVRLLSGVVRGKRVAMRVRGITMPIA